MTTDDPTELRRLIRADSHQIADLEEERTRLRDRLKVVAADLRSATARRSRRIIRARAAGTTVEELAADSGYTPARIRQIAPQRKRAAARRPVAPVDPAPVDDDDQEPAHQLLGDDDQERPQASDQPPVDDHQEPPADPPQASAPAPRPAPARRRTAPQASAGPYSITGRVTEVLTECGGDADAAIARLTKRYAVPDAMQLLDQCRTGARYDYTAYPPVPAPLQRTGRKDADMIWEGRPKYRNALLPPQAMVVAWDANGAYLSALRRVHLPIGRLVDDRERGADPAEFDPRRSGIYLIDPPQWDHPGLPNPLGDGREEPGPLWVTDSTLRLMLRAASGKLEDQTGNKRPLCEAPKILESYTSGSSESMLGKFGDTLADARRTAIAAGDDVTLTYIKAMYAKFVSTAGVSKANHALARPEWVHAIRSQAYANLWYKAHRVWVTDCTAVYRMSGTDELHVTGPWKTVMRNGRPLFVEGRDLAEMKIKHRYVIRDDKGRDDKGTQHG